MTTQFDEDLEFMSKDLAPIDRVNYMNNRINDVVEMIKKDFREGRLK